jgi:hypothetical protein
MLGGVVEERYRVVRPVEASLREDRGSEHHVRPQGGQMIEPVA